MQYGFHFNGLRCTGCKTCMRACKDYHDLPFSIAFRQVYELAGGGWTVDGTGCPVQDVFAYYVSVGCNHCANPVCMRVCPTGAMHKNDGGLVTVDERRCIGCGYCALSCPYRAPKVDREAGHSVKCDGCAERVAAGEQPICVEACPLRALDFGPVEELRERFGSESDLRPLPPSSETFPNLVITLPAPVAADPARVREEGAVGNVGEIV